MNNNPNIDLAISGIPCLCFYCITGSETDFRTLTFLRQLKLTVVRKARLLREESFCGTSILSRKIFSASIHIAAENHEDIQAARDMLILVKQQKCPSRYNDVCFVFS